MSLERSQAQEQKIYDRLRREKRHQQDLWAEMIHNDSDVKDLNNSRNSLDLSNYDV